MIRFVADPQGVVTPDLAARLPGRGVWVGADRDSLALAMKKGAFQRGLKAGVRIPDGLEALVERLLAERALSTLGLGKRAGAVAAGFRQVDEAIRAARPFGLIEASDGAADGRLKLTRLAAHLWGAAPAVVGCFTAAELGVALGRDPVVHAAWLQERMARRWAEDIRRLSGFRAIHPVSWRSDATEPRGDTRGEPHSSPASAAIRVAQANENDEFTDQHD